MCWGKLYIGISCSRLLRISSGCSYKLPELGFCGFTVLVSELSCRVAVNHSYINLLALE